MGAIIDHTGQRFGQLFVIGPARDERGRLKWDCTCDCGGSTSVFGNNLRSGGTTTCGCLRSMHPPELSKTRLYNVWCGMIARCADQANSNYGARGIRVCRAWRTFATFYQWAVANGHDADLTLDRIDVDKGYYPRNCRWATAREQARNTRRTVWVTHDGRSMSLKEAAENLCLDYGRLQKRMRQCGMSFDQAVAAVSAYRRPPPHLNFLARRSTAADQDGSQHEAMLACPSTAL